MAEPGRQSNTPTLLLGYARDEIVAATGCTLETAASTLSNGLERQRLGFTHGHVEGQLPSGVTDVASHLFGQRGTDEKLEYDFPNSSVIRSGLGYSYVVRNIRVERIALMAWCREDNLLLPEMLSASPFELSPDFTRPALTQQHSLRAESFSVGALDFATPVLTVRPGPGQAAPPETPESTQEPAGQLELMAANPTEPAPASPVAAVTAEGGALDVKLSNPESWPEGLRKLIELMKTHSPPPAGRSPAQWYAKKQDPKKGKVLTPKSFSNLMPAAIQILEADESFPRAKLLKIVSRGKFPAK